MGGGRPVSGKRMAEGARFSSRRPGLYRPRAAGSAATARRSDEQGRLHENIVATASQWACDASFSSFESTTMTTGRDRRRSDGLPFAPFFYRFERLRSLFLGIDRLGLQRHSLLFFICEHITVQAMIQLATTPALFGFSQSRPVLIKSLLSASSPQCLEFRREDVVGSSRALLIHSKHLGSTLDNPSQPARKNRLDRASDEVDARMQVESFGCLSHSSNRHFSRCASSRAGFDGETRGLCRVTPRWTRHRFKKNGSTHDG